MRETEFSYSSYFVEERFSRSLSVFSHHPAKRSLIAHFEYNLSLSLTHTLKIILTSPSFERNTICWPGRQNTTELQPFKIVILSFSAIPLFIHVTDYPLYSLRFDKSHNFLGEKMVIFPVASCQNRAERTVTIENIHVRNYIIFLITGKCVKKCTHIVQCLTYIYVYEYTREQIDVGQ